MSEKTKYDKPCEMQLRAFDMLLTGVARYVL